MNTGETRGYVLTFRCINCGKHEVFAKYPTEEVECEDRIRGRIYKVTCYSCGWSGDACGVSAICISRTTELKAKAVEQRPATLVQLFAIAQAKFILDRIDEKWPGGWS